MSSDPKPSVAVVDNPAAGRWELRHDDRVVGVVEYAVRDDVVVIPHVEVIPELRGGGHSAPFLDEVLGHIAASGRRVRPLCGYAAAHMRRRPELAAMLDLP